MMGGSGGGSGGSGGNGNGDGRRDGGDNNLMGGSFKPDAKSGPAFAFSGAAGGNFGAFNVGGDSDVVSTVKSLAPIMLAMVVVWVALKKR